MTNLEKLQNYALHGPAANQKQFVGGLMETLGLKAAPLSHSFDYEPERVQYQTNPFTESAMNNIGTSAAGMTQDISGVRDAAGSLQDMTNKAYDQAQTFMDPESAWYKTQMNRMREGLSGQEMQRTNLQNRNLAMRGISGGSMRNLLSDISGSGMGEQLRQGQFNLINQGNQLASSWMNQAMSGQQGVGSLYGQAGQLGAQQGGLYAQQGQLGQAESQAALQAAMANQTAANEAQQFNIMGDYNQAAQNAANTNAFGNQILGLAGTLLTGGLSDTLMGTIGSGMKSAGTWGINQLFGTPTQT